MKKKNLLLSFLLVGVVQYLPSMLHVGVMMTLFYQPHRNGNNMELQHNGGRGRIA